MKSVLTALAAAVLLTGLAPAPAAAQQSPWWEWALREVRQSQVWSERDDRERRRDRDGNVVWRERREDRGRDEGRGPPFCRSGKGHPVHGREWCRDKGFGLGSRDLRWEDRGWEDIILRTPRERDRDRRRGTVDDGGLIDILGDVVYGRLLLENRRLGGDEPLTGRWVHPDRGVSVLQIRSGALPVAELSDVDGDGRVDVVLVPRR